MPKSAAIKILCDEPMPNLRCEEEYSLWPISGLFDRDSLSLDPMTLDLMTWDHERFDLHLKHRPTINEWRCDPYWLAPTFPVLYCDDKRGPWGLHLHPGSSI